MDLEQFKRWHWAVIGLLAGTLWAGSRAMYPAEVDGRRTMLGPFHLLLLASEKAPRQEQFGVEYEYLSDLVVHAPFDPDAKTRVLMENAAGGAEVPKSARGQWVTGTVHVMEPAKDAKGRYQMSFWSGPKGLHEVRGETFHYLAAVPFRPPAARDAVAKDVGSSGLKKIAGYQPPATGEYRDVRAYFDEVNRKYGGSALTYRYAWWEAPAAVATLYPLAGLVVIGGVWPTLLGLMVGMGFGQRREKREGLDLSKFKGDSKAAAVAARRDLTDTERGQLATLEAEMERRLDGFGAAGDPPMPAVESLPHDAAPGPVALTAAPVESVAAPEKPQVAKSFGGDFYPTEIHHDAKKP